MLEVVCVDDYAQDVVQRLRGALEGDREGDLDDRHPRGARLRAPVLLDRDPPGAGRDLPDRGLRRLGDAAASASRRSTPTPTSGSRSCAPTARASARRRRSASTPRSTRRRSRPPTAPPATRTTRPRCASSRPQSPISMRHIINFRSDRQAIEPACGGHRGGTPRLPDRDLVDELRLAVRARLPRLRRGREADQRALRQRRGRRDPRHVRPLPQVARPAGRLGALRRLGRDAERLLPRRDQDRPGREARRGRPPAGQEGLREGRRGP